MGHLGPELRMHDVPESRADTTRSGPLERAPEPPHVEPHRRGWHRFHEAVEPPRSLRRVPGLRRLFLDLGQILPRALELATLPGRELRGLAELAQDRRVPL